jgi:hypothetical protein
MKCLIGHINVPSLLPSVKEMQYIFPRDLFNLICGNDIDSKYSRVCVCEIRPLVDFRKSHIRSSVLIDLTSLLDSKENCGDVFATPSHHGQKETENNLTENVLNTPKNITSSFSISPICFSSSISSASPSTLSSP